MVKLIYTELSPIVRIVRGREADQYAVGKEVVDDRYVLLADGEQKAISDGRTPLPYRA